jgi:hypothetical protein
MSAILRIFTVLSIGAVLLVGVFAYGIKRGFLPAVIRLPEESVCLTLIPLVSAEETPDRPAEAR